MLLRDRVLAVLLTAFGIAATVPAVAANDVCRPGYVNYNIPLSTFAAPELAPACSLLQSGDLADARTQFDRYLHDHPGDPSAIVGSIQAATGDPAYATTLLKQYEDADQREASPANDLKLGLTAFYALGDEFRETGPDAEKTGKSLQKIARSKLQSAYDGSRSPIVGFILENSYMFTGGGDRSGVLEDILERMSGPEVSKAYLRAKKSNWNASLPPVPDLPKAQLEVLRWVVGSLWALNGMQHAVRPVSGSESAKLAPLTSLQESAQDYLEEWLKQIRTASEKKS
jgi:hypothetical protein